MISAGNRNPLYDGVPVPTSPAPSTLHTDDQPISPTTAAAQVDGAVGTTPLTKRSLDRWLNVLARAARAVGQLRQTDGMSEESTARLTVCASHLVTLPQRIIPT